MRNNWSNYTVYFFVLFILLSCFFVSCKKDKNQPEQNAEQKTSIENEISIYNPTDDNGIWIDELLIKLEEERIAQELAQMEEELSDYVIPEESFENDPLLESKTEGSSDETSNSSEVEKFFEKQLEGRVRSGKKEELTSFEFDNEVFLPQKSSNGIILVHSTGSKVLREFYGEDLRVYKKEYWYIPSAKDAKKESTENLEYSKTGKIIKRSVLTDSSLEEINYNENGNVLSVNQYGIYEDTRALTLERYLSYDETGFCFTDERIEHVYKDKEFKKPDYSFNKKYVYSFNSDDIPPDFEYFENGILKMKNKYSVDKGSYTSQVFFDNNFSVKAYYENEVRVRDVYYNGNTALKEKVYEN